jgi:large subunit ribosomal protein L18
MKKHKTYTIAYRRKREGKTDYKKRLKLLLSKKPRLVVRVFLKNITAQIVEYHEKGDKVLASVSSQELKKLGWNYNPKNIPSAYLIGALIAKKAKENKVSEAILDIGMNEPVVNSKVYAVLKGAVENGLKVPLTEDVLPSDERVSGKHIEDYANQIKENQEEYNKKFSACIKNNADPIKITSIFQEIKNKIIGA